MKSKLVLRLLQKFADFEPNIDDAIPLLYHQRLTADNKAIPLQILHG